MSQSLESLHIWVFPVVVVHSLVMLSLDSFVPSQCNFQKSFLAGPQPYVLCQVSCQFWRSWRSCGSSQLLNCYVACQTHVLFLTGFTCILQFLHLEWVPDGILSHSFDFLAVHWLVQLGLSTVLSSHVIPRKDICDWIHLLQKTDGWLTPSRQIWPVGKSTTLLCLCCWLH